MARGWESKHVESQQEEARRTDSRPAGAPPAPPEVRPRRQMLELAPARAEAELFAASAPPHRAMLRQALDAINEQLRELTAP